MENLAVFWPESRESAVERRSRMELGKSQLRLTNKSSFDETWRPCLI